jgi:hypothetical protein
VLKTGLPSNTHSKACSQAKNHSTPVTFGLDWILAFLLSESPKPRYTQEPWNLQSASQVPRSWLESWVCTQLEPPSRDLGPLLWPAGRLWTMLLFLQSGKAGDQEGNLLLSSFCFYFHFKRSVTLLHVERSKETTSGRLSMESTKCTELSERERQGEGGGKAYPRPPCALGLLPCPPLAFTKSSQKQGHTPHCRSS